MCFHGIGKYGCIGDNPITIILQIGTSQIQTNWEEGCSTIRIKMLKK